MYLPRSFRVTDDDEIRAFVARHGFATLVTQGDAGPLVSHVPLMLDPDAGPRGSLLGHMARANPHWRVFAPDAAPSLAIFHGPHAYISPAWDVEPIVPTWNYAVVHAAGRPAVIEDDARVTALLDALVTRYEAERAEPWSLALSEQMRATLHGAIVAFEIPLESIEAKYKLSQNRAPEDQRGALAGLASEGGAEELVSLWRDSMARRPPD